MISESDVLKALEGNMGVTAALLSAKVELGDAVIAFFLDLLPERGEKLWIRFRNFQRETNNHSANFHDFITAVMTQNINKLPYPKGCTLDNFTRNLLSGKIQRNMKAAGLLTDEGLIKSYFSEGEPYAIVRGIACKGCPECRCRHFKKMF